VILSPPSGRPRLSVLAVPAGIGRPTGVLDLDEVAPGIWLRAVEVRKAVLLSQPAARKRAAVETPDLRVCGEVSHSPAHVARRLLRTFVETTAKLAWISRDVHRRSGVFLNTKSQDMKTLLKEIGWEDEYERTYKILNHYIHTDPKVSASGFYRTYEWGEGDLFPELGPETKHYLFKTSHGAAVLGENLMSRQEARQLYEPFLTVKVFDIALAGLRLLYGNTSMERGWWPGEVLPTFVRLCDRVPGLAALIRWPSA
jgi:hypothetical protein